MLKIKNEYLQVSIATKGAEARSVINLTTLNEYMWDGNTQIWSDVSPVLFPIVGKVKNDQVLFKNKAYHLTNHGFARHSEFKLITQTRSAITLAINTQELGDEYYPFNLRFSVSYRLEDKVLITEYMVENLDKQIAYFSVGAHPAFKCPFDDKHSLADYTLEFEHQEQLIKHEINDLALLTGQTQAVALTKLTLSEHIFDNGALIFSNYTSQNVTLVEQTSGRKISVSLTNFPFLGLWSKPQAPYVCIEPWCGHSDMLNSSGEVNLKPAIIKLAAQATWKNHYSIHFDY